MPLLLASLRSGTGLFEHTEDVCEIGWGKLEFSVVQRRVVRPCLQGLEFENEDSSERNGELGSGILLWIKAMAELGLACRIGMRPRRAACIMKWNMVGRLWYLVVLSQAHRWLLIASPC